MHTVFALLCFVVVIHWLIFPYPSGLLHWHCGNLTIAPVPAKQPWWIWINTSCEFIMNDCITTTKQSTTKPCAYFLGYTVGVGAKQIFNKYEGLYKWSWFRYPCMGYRVKYCKSRFVYYKVFNMHWDEHIISVAILESVCCVYTAFLKRLIMSICNQEWLCRITIWNLERFLVLWRRWYWVRSDLYLRLYHFGKVRKKGWFVS